MGLTRRTGRWVAAGIAVLGVALGASAAVGALPFPAVAGTSTPVGSDADVVRGTFVKAMSLWMGVRVIGPARRPAATTLTTPPPVTALRSDAVAVARGGLAAATINDMAQADQPAVAALFTGDAATTVNAAENNVVASAEQSSVTPTRDRVLPTFAAGTSGVRFKKVSVAGDSAHITAVVDTWTAVGQVQDGGDVAIAVPSNRIVVDAALVGANGVWKVANFGWRFVDDGSEP
jgi:hypothetical protein